MQSAGTGEAAFQGGFQHAGALAQPAPGVFERETLDEIFWSHSGPVGEKPVEMEGAESGARRQGLQARLFSVVLIQVPDDGGNAFVIAHDRTLTPARDGAHPILAAKSLRFPRAVEGGHAPAGRGRCWSSINDS